MAARQTFSRNLKSIAGAILFAVGLFLLFVHLDELAAQAGNVADTSARGLGMLPALGLAGWHAVQAYTFDQARFLSGLQQILISFWPLVLIVAGALLLRDIFRGRFAQVQSGTRSSAAGNRS